MDSSILQSRFMMFRIGALHVAALAAFFVPFQPSLLVLATVMFFWMQLGYEGVCHRYFAHRSYKTSRGFQLLLAVWGSSTGQKGMLWWADSHRQHHRHTDQPQDAHSPVQHGRWHAHVAWLWQPEHLQADARRVRDLRAFPELVWLDTWWDLVPNALMLGMFLAGGLPWVLWGACLPMALSLHATWLTNSFTHFHDASNTSWGRSRRFSTDDRTNNAPWLAIPLVGANWHNNHHRYPAAARAGFYPGELDLAYGMLKLFETLGLVWDLREVPEAVLEEGRTHP